MLPLVRLASFAAVVALCAGVLGHGILQQELSCADDGGQTPTVDEKLQLLKDRVAKKQAIAEQLATGRISLVEAASRLGALNLPLLFWINLPIADPAQTTEESLCRHIMELAIDRAADSSAAGVLRERLQKELREATDAQGRVVLPRPFFDVVTAQVSVE